MFDSGTPFLLLFALVAGVIVLIWIVSYKRDQKRRRELAAWASSNGWRYFPGQSGNVSLPFSPFGKGHSRYRQFQMETEWGNAVPGLAKTDVQLFEYHYAETTSDGKSSSTTHYYHACSLAVPGPDLGVMTIRKENLADKLVQMIGFEDIDFEDPIFSKHFVVKARDRKRAFEVIDQRMMDFLVAHPGWRIETNGPMLFVHRTGRISAGVCDQLSEFQKGFLASLPRPLVNEARIRQGLAPELDAGNAAESGEGALG